MMLDRKKTIYLDNAASSFPKPPAVVKRMNEVMRLNTSNPGRSGHRMSGEAARWIYETRVVAAEYFGMPGREENIVFTMNATHAINIAINGLLSQGDGVIISDIEHNSVLRPLTELQNRGVITLSVAETSDDDGETEENFRRLINSGTKLIFVSHASNVNGKLLPVERLGKLCREHGLIFCVDASQTAGHIGYDLGRSDIDILCTSGHKGLFGPQGTGILAINRNPGIKPLIFGGTGGYSLLRTQPEGLPESLESGTLNTPGITGLGEGIRFLIKNGSAFKEKTKKLYDMTFRGIASVPGIEIYSRSGSEIPLLAFNITGVHSEKTTALLDSSGICVRGGYHCSALFHSKYATEKQGAVRASMSGFNTEDDIRSFISACRLVTANIPKTV